MGLSGPSIFDLFESSPINNCTTIIPRRSGTVPDKTQWHADSHLLLQPQPRPSAPAEPEAAPSIDARHSRCRKLEHFVASLPLRRASSKHCCYSIPERSAILPHKTQWHGDSPSRLIPGNAASSAGTIRAQNAHPAAPAEPRAAQISTPNEPGAVEHSMSWYCRASSNSCCKIMQQHPGGHLQTYLTKHNHVSCLQTPPTMRERSERTTHQSAPKPRAAPVSSLDARGARCRKLHHVVASLYILLRRTSSQQLPHHHSTAIRNAP